MRRMFLAWLVVGLFAAPAYALDLLAPTSAEETITVSSSAIGITTSVCTDGTKRQKAMIQVKSNGIYFSLHSSTATPDSGDFEAVAGDLFKLSEKEVSKLRMIRSGGADATVKVQCYGN